MKDSPKSLRINGAALQVSLLAAGLLGAIVVATSMGYIKIPVGDILRVITGAIFGHGNWDNTAHRIVPYVVLDVRLPRILTSVVVGAGLAIAGVIFQGILLNPLADPYTLGISAGAAFGASVALLFNFSALGIYSVPMFAFIGAIATLGAVIYLSSQSGGVSSNSLILSGIIVAAILSAGISFLKYIADEHVSVIIFWLMGSFASKTWSDVLLTLIFVSGGGLICMLFAGDLNILSLGDRSAVSLGVRAGRLRIMLLVTASLMTAVCVSVSGIIGFVGLIIPHLLRSITGADNRRLIPCSALAGAILLLSADTVTRAILPNEVPIGVLTAVIGGPVFCYIFKKRYQFRADG